jgi:hypothetical protein
MDPSRPRSDAKHWSMKLGDIFASRVLSITAYKANDLNLLRELTKNKTVFCPIS